MIDPEISLAFSMYSNRGAYALLLGSGVSRSAGIPTGWEVVQDLIRKLAHVQRADCLPTPEEWFRKTYEHTPDYSNLLDQLAKTPTERVQLLRSYFEPNEHEREGGLKSPTAAHRAIADLMASGFVRIVITTNFDRLLEVALADRGVQPTVISSADAVLGMLPLPHIQALILKVNGDYVDSRIKNTSSELESYEAPIVKLLDRIFDEFGLLVCGWSAEWDIALRTCIERCPSRRFTTYWTTKGPLATKAADLVALRSAEPIEIVGADPFFKALSGKVTAFADLGQSHPASAKIAVAQAKRSLASETRLIELHDLVADETERLCSTLSAAEFDPNARGDLDEWRSRIERYERRVETVLALLNCGAYWGKSPHERIWSDALARVANCTSGLKGGSDIYLHLRLYPAMLLLYGAGVTAVAAQRFRTIAALLNVEVREWFGDKSNPAFIALSHDSVFQRTEEELPGVARHYTPASDYLHTTLREPVREYIRDDVAYTAAFDWFEYLLALVTWERDLGWAPIGGFGWRNSHAMLRLASDAPLLMEFMNRATEAGFFGGSADQFRTVQAGFQEWAQRVAGRWH